MFWHIVIIIKNFCVLRKQFSTMVVFDFSVCSEIIVDFVTRRFLYIDLYCIIWFYIRHERSILCIRDFLPLQAVEYSYYINRFGRSMKWNFIVVSSLYCRCKLLTENSIEHVYFYKIFFMIKFIITTDRLLLIICYKVTGLRR